VREKETKVIDPEFAFYGPMGYDVGNVIANLMFAWANGHAVMGDDKKRSEYIVWLEQTMIDVVDLFRSKFSSLWDVSVQDVMAKEAGFKEYYLQGVLTDTAAVTGLELIRRIVGLAGVKDITSIGSEHDRITAERVLLTAAKTFIKNRQAFVKGQDFLDTILKAQQDFDWKTRRDNDEQTAHIHPLGS
jgi:5-methylthioribose kinase